MTIYRINSTDASTWKPVIRECIIPSPPACYKSKCSVCNWQKSCINNIDGESS